MYKLLIVDDEPTVRTGLSSYFDWSSHGIEVIGEADDGDVALAFIEQELPDLILSDIRMPNMDGITMARQISATYPEVQIIFVSGHDDAEYLKSAMKVSAVDYIFKPVNLQELTEVIKKVVADLDYRGHEQRRKEEMRSKLKEGMPLLREKFLLSLIGNAIPKHNLQDRLAFLGLELPIEASYWIMAISVDDLGEVTALRSEVDRQLLWYSVLNICRELIDVHMSGYAFEHRSGEFVGILRTEPLADDAQDAANVLLALAADIRENLERWLKIGVTIGIGDRADSLAELAQGYKQAREAVTHKWYLGKNRIITMNSLENPESDGGGSSKFDPEHQEQLVSALKAADLEKVREVLDLLFSDMNRNRTAGLKYGRNVCLQMALVVGQLLMELNVQSPELESAESVLWEALFEQETIGEMRQLIESHLLSACDRIREKRTGKVANLAERVRAIIEHNYADGNLTVEVIGKEVYLTPTYVSLLYKQETGQTINEYLTQVRVERAKAMLRDHRYKFYDICYAIGYTDPSYFTKLFKKSTGVTPSVYRDSHV
ncbi:response regulator [Paenibacillus sp. CF384]|uniref:response regulator n=1 Tax=Paenibacillus sp. CF384 TaxID=1884382 RepID=UPI000896E323|nr:response regulator [Paenibacillus sp. CF384]SDW98503.1 two component transcriptional regulator, AraC family [Paenibacillus sp. CF384]